jgi:hypothetical protein
VPRGAARQRHEPVRQPILGERSLWQLTDGQLRDATEESFRRLQQAEAAYLEHLLENDPSATPADTTANPPNNSPSTSAHQATTDKAPRPGSRAPWSPLRAPVYSTAAMTSSDTSKLA